MWKIMQNYPKINFCDLCGKWIHFKCSFLTNEQFDSLRNSDLPNFCTKCNSDILPFQYVNDEEFSSNLTVTEFAMSKMDITSKLLQATSKNVACNNQYRNTQDFNNKFAKTTNFFILHVNIRSLNKNIDKLEELLLELGKLPDIIALSETKLKNSFSCFLDGYKFIQSNSDPNAGGVGLFVRNNINFIVTDQYKLNVPNCQDLWIEVKQKTAKDKYLE